MDCSPTERMDELITDTVDCKHCGARPNFYTGETMYSVKCSTPHCMTEAKSNINMDHAVYHWNEYHNKRVA